MIIFLGALKKETRPCRPLLLCPGEDIALQLETEESEAVLIFLYRKVPGHDCCVPTGNARQEE
jgi:hypothetical protein